MKTIICCLVAFALHSGCAATPVIHAPPTSEERDRFGTVGVARALYPPETGIDVYAIGGTAGAVKGATSYFGGVLLGGLMYTPPEPYTAAAYLCLVGAAAVVAIPIGAVAGVFKAMPSAEAVSCDALVRQILGKTNPQEDLQEEILRSGAAETGRQLLLIDDAGPASPDNVASYGSLSGKGIRTILEISVERITLAAKKGGSNPPLALMMEARSRLIHVGDETAVDYSGHDNRYGYTSSPRTYAEWADDNAVLLHQEYEEALRDLAAEIIDWNFGALR